MTMNRKAKEESAWGKDEAENLRKLNEVHGPFINPALSAAKIKSCISALIMNKNEATYVLRTQSTHFFASDNCLEVLGYYLLPHAA